MKRNRCKSIVVVSALCVLCIAVTLCRAGEVQKAERIVSNNLLAATEQNDYEAFLKDATAEVKAALTKQMLEGVSAQVAPHMKKGYEATYFGNLTQQGCEVHLWKLVYRDGHDDTLAKLVLKNGKVAGFWLQ
jgi:hypothetical protein